MCVSIRVTAGFEHNTGCFKKQVFEDSDNLPGICGLPWKYSNSLGTALGPRVQWITVVWSNQTDGLGNFPRAARKDYPSTSKYPHQHVRCHIGPFVTPFWDPLDRSPLGSSVHGIFFQARILEWVAISFSKGSCWSRDQTHISCTGRQILYYPSAKLCNS